jgi:hypothetical protein
VCDKHVERWDKILDKIDACTARIRARQAQIAARKAAGHDTTTDERWLATEFDFLCILVDVLRREFGEYGCSDA